jgi:hypothetical protein
MFLDAAVPGSGDWQLTLHLLTAKRPMRGPTFMGFQVKRRVVVDAMRAGELATRLGSYNSYLDGGEWGCADHSKVGVRLARGRFSIEFIYGCGNLYLTELRHEGSRVLFSSDMVLFLNELRDEAKLW